MEDNALLSESYIIEYNDMKVFMVIDVALSDF